MLFFRIFVLIITLCITLGIKGQADTKNLFGEKGEIYFSFEYPPYQSIEKISKIISIDCLSDQHRIFAYANQREFEEFLSLQIPFEILPHPGDVQNPLMKDHIYCSIENSWDFYPTYEAYIDIMYQFEANHPELCDVFSIGTSEEGRQLLMAKISDNVDTEEGEARCLYTSTMHGDEVAGYVLMLHLIDYLLLNYNADEKVTNLLDNLEIWINPLANPDGTYAGGNNTLQGATRYNANNVDLNRNFPDPEDGDHPDENPWQKETIEFMELADSVSFVLSANFHGGSEVFNYPWDTWPQLHADDDWWQYVGREWADTVHYYAPLGYFDDLNNGITNGYAWYTVAGGRQDFMNYFHHCREVTVELSQIKILPANQLPDFWEYNYRSFLNYLEQALFGLTGTITDTISGEPLSANVFIENFDSNNSWVTSDAVHGKYFRPLYEGVYDITFSASGYQSKTYYQVNTINRELMTLNVELLYTGSGTPEIGNPDIFQISPNPSNGLIELSFQDSRDLDCDISVINAVGIITERYIHHFSPGSDTFIIKLTNHSSGIYFIVITSDNFVLKQKIIIK